MKNKILQKLFRFLTNWIRSRFAEQSSGKPKFGETERHKKLSPAHEHLLKVAHLLKNRFRHKAWAKH